MIYEGAFAARERRAKEMKETAKGSLASGEYVRARDEYRIALLENPRIMPEIILDYERALESSEGDVGLRLSLADFYLKVGDAESLLMELEEILDINPKIPQIYNILGQILMKRGAIGETITLLERALKENIKDTSLTEMLAGAYLERGDISKSILLYEEILGRGGDNKKTLRVMGDLYGRVGKNLESASAYLKLFDADPSTYGEVVHKLSGLVSGDDAPVIRERLAEVYLKGRDPERAVGEYKQIFKREKHRIKESITKYRSALETFPGHPGLQMALSDALIETGSYTEAAHELAKLSKMGGEFLKDAVQGYLKIIKKYPDNVLAHHFLGDAYLMEGRHEDALAEYRVVLSMDGREADNISKKCRDILKVRPDLSPLHLTLGEIHLIKKEFKKAVAEGDDVLSMEPENVDAFILLGDGFRGEGLFIKSLDSYRTAMSHDPYNISVHKKIEETRRMEIDEEVRSLKDRIKEDPWRKSLHLDLAKLCQETMDWEGTAKEIQEALRDQARAPFAYNLFGIALKEQGKWELAASQFAKALETLPKELGDVEKNVLFNLATAYEASGRIDEAIKTCESIREKDVSFADIESKIKSLMAVNPKAVRNKMFAVVLQNFSSGIFLEMWGRDSRQVSMRHAEDLGISFAQTHNDKGFDYMAKGLYKSAEEEFLLASSLDARLPSSLNNLAVIYAHQGRLDDAGMKLSAALEADPKSAIIHNNIGVIAYLKGDFKGAEVALLRALSLDPELACANINLGDAYYAQGNARRAITHWERVKNFSIVSELAQRRLRGRALDSQ